MRSAVAVVTVCLLGAACANRPESIHASYVSHEKFAHLDCPALDAKMRATRVSLAQYSQIQNSKADQDAIGVFLFGVPFSKLSGDVEGEVARLKGEVEAIETASIKKQCSTQTAGTMVNPTGDAVAAAAPLAAVAPATADRPQAFVTTPNSWVSIVDPDELRSVFSDTTIRGRLYGRNTADGTPYVGKYRSDGTALVTFKGRDYPRTWEIRGIDTTCSRGTDQWDCYQLKRNSTNPNVYYGKNVSRDLWVEFTVERQTNSGGPVAAAPTNPEPARPGTPVAAASAVGSGAVGAVATASSPGPSTLASSAPAAARQGPAIDGPLPGAGATWKYDFVDKYYPRNSTRFSVRVVRTAGDVVEEVLSAEGSTADPKIRTVLLRELRIQNYRPTQNCVVLEFAPYMAVEFGQQVPAPSNPISGYPGTDGKDAGWRIRILRQSWERITVPAGTYPALRVELRGEQTNKQFRWGETGQFDLVVWYAPAVKRVVRVEHKSWAMGATPLQHGSEVIELISYQPPS